MIINLTYSKLSTAHFRNLRVYFKNTYVFNILVNAYSTRMLSVDINKNMLSVLVIIKYQHNFQQF